MNLQENWARTKEMALALWRQGVHELGAAFYGTGTAAQSPEYGMPHTKMAIEVAEGQRGEDRGPAQESPSILGERLKQAEEARDVRETPSREPERE